MLLLIYWNQKIIIRYFATICYSIYFNFQYYMGHIYGNYNRYHQGFLLCEFLNLCLVFFIVYISQRLTYIINLWCNDFLNIIKSIISFSFEFIKDDVRKSLHKDFGNRWFNKEFNRNVLILFIGGINQILQLLLCNVMGLTT